VLNSTLAWSKTQPVRNQNCPRFTPETAGFVMCFWPDLTRREITCVPLDAMLGKVNQSLRGWVGYFHCRNCSRALGKLRWHTEECLCTHLRKRHKIRHRWKGYARFNRTVLYEQYGLYKVPATAGWTTAHAVRWRTSESRVRENRMHGLMREGWSNWVTRIPE